MNPYDDPFQEARAKCPIHVGTFQGEKVPMILRLKDVREAAKDTVKFSSDAPRRVPIPPEEDVRTVRQYPLEVDPPEHEEYRRIVEPFFLRPKQPDVLAKIHGLIESLLTTALESGSIDAVKDFAIPLQSRALTYLLNVPEKEAELWISWGIHVFKDGDGKSKGPFMETYCQRMFEAAAENPGDDFFSALNQAEFQGRPLTMEEKLGYPGLEPAGELNLHLPPWNDDYGTRIWPNVIPLPEGYPAPYIALMMDRVNFPGMPKQNWTYGALYLYHGHPAEP